jgi:hypothetical protein
VSIPESCAGVEPSRGAPTQITKRRAFLRQKEHPVELRPFLFGATVTRAPAWRSIWMAAVLCRRAKDRREALFVELATPGRDGDAILQAATELRADVITVPVRPPARGTVPLSEGLGTFDPETFWALAKAADLGPNAGPGLLSTHELALARTSAWVAITTLRDGGVGLWYAEGASSTDDQRIAETLVDDLHRASPKRLPWALLEAPAGKLREAASAQKEAPRALRRPGAN